MATKPTWLRTSSGDLVEINSGVLVYSADRAEGTSRVVLRTGGLERELYRGHEVHEYLTGLARLLGATTPDSLVGDGTSGKRV